MFKDSKIKINRKSRRKVHDCFREVEGFTEIITGICFPKDANQCSTDTHE